MHTFNDLTSTEWHKSSYSQMGNDCVEWAPGCAPSGVVPVRDSKRPEGPAVFVSPAAWSSFVTNVKRTRRAL
ncbi:DUF397 domain-containing protein [Streptomyces morookaense]|uniref:DUF397 domain-containing protein n=1 Tax=Streptomyces morookaense TaxID=1970 RepID=UPI00340C5510